MRLTISAALAAASIFAFAQPAFSARHTEGWHQPQQWQQPAPARSVHGHRHHHVVVARPRAADPQKKLKLELTDLRRELDDLKQRLGAHPWDNVKVPFLQMEGDGGYKLASLPDLRQPLQEPAAPVVVIPDVDPLAAARAFLKLTATPGYTMMRQGIDVAIGRLHPAFVVRLADGIRWAREHGLPHAGVYSAYRPPSFGVGGFRDKFNSMHSYGLAVDMANIGGVGARLWQKAVQTVGLFLPYGPNNRAEFNHVQAVPMKVATARLRKTITANGPIDLQKMWVASGLNFPAGATESTVVGKK